LGSQVEAAAQSQRGEDDTATGVDVADLVYAQSQLTLNEGLMSGVDAGEEQKQSGSTGAMLLRLPASSRFRRLLREPLVHFLILGAMLFLGYQWKGSAGSHRIVVTSGEVEHLASGFVRTWQRPPSEAELKGLVDDYVKEEIATREAVNMGLDQNDTIIRRRLRQKLEFLADEGANSSPPTDAELQAWLDKHPDSYRAEPQIAFRQVYINPQRHAHFEETARSILAQLNAAGPQARTGTLGDPTMLPANQPLDRVSVAANTFGDNFSEELAKLPVGQWSGPVESSFGLHIVLVQQRAEGAVLPLAEVRTQVSRDFLRDRKASQLDLLYQGLLKKYSVSIELPKTERAAANGSAGPVQ
jgi:hypothetical protein